MTVTPVEVVNAVVLGLFTLGLVLTAIRMAWRLRRYRRLGLPIPRLLMRDLLFASGMLLPFLLILVVRVFGFAEQVRDQLAWTVVTGAPALFAVAVMVYYEWFVIER